MEAHLRIAFSLVVFAANTIWDTFSTATYFIYDSIAEQITFSAPEKRFAVERECTFWRCELNWQLSASP